MRKLRLFPFFGKKTGMSNDAGLEKYSSYQRRINDANQKRFCDRLVRGVKSFARNHRTVLLPADIAVLHDAAKELSPDALTNFLYRCNKEPLSLYFQKNNICLRRNHAVFVITKIESFPSGKMKVSYRTKIHRRRMVENDELV